MNITTTTITTLSIKDTEAVQLLEEKRQQLIKAKEIERDRCIELTRAFFYDLINRHEEDIYQAWTRWRPDSTFKGIVHNITILFTTILFDPIQFVISESGKTIAIFEDRLSLKLNVCALDKVIYEKYIFKMMTKWKTFFKEISSQTGMLTEGGMTYNKFYYNKILDQLFQRERIVEKLVFKLLFLSICQDDGGASYIRALDILSITFQNMILTEEKLQRKPTTMIPFMILMLSHIKKEGLYSFLLSKRDEHFISIDEDNDDDIIKKTQSFKKNPTDFFSSSQ